jgi:hypothetical protein
VLGWHVAVPKPASLTVAASIALTIGLLTPAWAADDKPRPTPDQMLKRTLERQSERQAAQPPANRPKRADPSPGAATRPARKPGTPAETRAALVALLRPSAPPPGTDELAALGSGVEDQLIAIARDDHEELSLRARAVTALGRAPLPTTATRLFLTGLLKPRAAPDKAGRPDAGATPPAAAANADLLLLRRAIVALGTIGGGRAPDLLAPLLAHADPDVRADAAVALALTRLPKAAEHLRARLALETDGRVRGLIARQLNVVDAALGREVPAK